MTHRKLGVIARVTCGSLALMASSFGWAGIIITKNVGAISASVVPGSQQMSAGGMIYPPGEGSVTDSQTSLALPQPQPSLSLRASQSFHGYTASSKVASRASAAEIYVTMGTLASASNENYRADATASLNIDFDVTAPASMEVVATGYPTGNGVSSTGFKLIRHLPTGDTSEVLASTVKAMPLAVGSYTVALDSRQYALWSYLYGSSATTGFDYSATMTFGPALQTTERGPDPTGAPGVQAQGPFTVASSVLPQPTGFGRATVYYPSNTAEGPFAAVVLTPDLLETQKQMGWIAPRLASWGFVVIAMDTSGWLDSATSRSAQTMAALSQAVSWSAQGGSPIAGKIDGARLGAVGHGTGNPLDTALDNPSLGAVIAFAPKLSMRDVSGVQAPSLIVACSGDLIAPPKLNAYKAYDKLGASVRKAEVTYKSGGHACTSSSASDANKNALVSQSVSWLKVFLDKDARFKPFLCGAATSLTGAPILAERNTCPF